MFIKEILYDSAEYKNSLELRYRVLRKPLGLIFSSEFLAQDKDQIHIAAFENEIIQGILILKPLDKYTLQMRQVAVDFNLQGLGIGKKMVIFAEKLANERHFTKIVLHARKTAVDFYLRLNYKIEGEEFTEVGIPHIQMYKDELRNF